MSARLRQHARRGFTLMEVLIAVAITALIGGMVASAFHTGVKTKEIIEGDAERYRMLRAAMDRMAREIGSAFVSDRYDTRRYRDSNDRPTNFIGEREKLLFTSLAHERLYTNAKESDQMVVEYQVKSSTEKDVRGRQDLMRRENPLVQDKMDRGGT
ncbi:MAG TPA: prepilin-type N-terminal cleavage/methylation domain-containing protein, partial [Myxococcaceae bacterium]|nr:prepilin-type N-terminal cleavage/methylation domain-containing protein [Myxococcaceae bacterium]